MKIRTFFVDPKHGNKFSMARGMSFLFGLAAIYAAFTLESPIGIVTALLTASTACLGVRSRAVNRQ